MSKILKTITISEDEYLHDEGLASEKTVTRFIVEVRVPQEEDQTQGGFKTLAEAEEYASDVAKRPLKPIKNMNDLMRKR